MCPTLRVASRQGDTMTSIEKKLGAAIAVVLAIFIVWFIWVTVTGQPPPEGGGPCRRSAINPDEYMDPEACAEIMREG